MRLVIFVQRDVRESWCHVSHHDSVVVENNYDHWNMLLASEAWMEEACFVVDLSVYPNSDVALKVGYSFVSGCLEPDLVDCTCSFGIFQAYLYQGWRSVLDWGSLAI